MKSRFISKKSWVPFLAVLVILTLTIMNGCLYTSNKAYRQKNRELIIQNDSVLSINIELKEALNDRKQAGDSKEQQKLSKTHHER